jgi:hypothetical protein
VAALADGSSTHACWMNACPCRSHWHHCCPSNAIFPTTAVWCAYREMHQACSAVAKHPLNLECIREEDGVSLLMRMCTAWACAGLA